MKKSLETGSDKVKNICKLLREETLEPAKREAQEIVENARNEAVRIVEEAQKQTEELFDKKHREIEREKQVMLSALEQAGQQSLEALRQDIEKKLFYEEVHALVNREVSKPEVIARLISSIVHALERDGMGVELEAVLPKSVKVDAVFGELADAIKKKLKGRGLQVGQFAGGAQIKLVDKKITFDISDEVLKDLLVRYLRKDFRKIIFGEQR